MAIVNKTIAKLLGQEKVSFTQWAICTNTNVLHKNSVRINACKNDRWAEWKCKCILCQYVALMEKKISSYCASQRAMQLSFSALHLLVMEKKFQHHLVFTDVQIFVSALVFIKRHQIQDAPKEQINSVHSNQNVYHAEYLCEQDIKVLAGWVWFSLLITSFFDTSLRMIQHLCR